MRINTNLTALRTHKSYVNNNNSIADSVKKLSSGYQINSAADNAAGLAISEKMRAQIRGLQQASINSQDGISLVQTAEGGMGQATEVLQRMRELAVQSANDTNENEIDREALNDEFTQLQEELDHLAKSTTFNKKNLLDGTLAKMHMATADLTLANNGISINLGNVAAGSYAFEAIVKPEKSAVQGMEAEFTPVSTSDAISILPGASTFEAGTADAAAAVEVGGVAGDRTDIDWTDTGLASAVNPALAGQTLTATVGDSIFEVTFMNPADADAEANTQIDISSGTVNDAFNAAVEALNAQIAAANEAGAAGNADYTQIDAITLAATTNAAIADTTTTTTPQTVASTAPSVTNNLGETALPNGNYTMEATYNSATFELSIAAIGDNGQTFTAVLDRTALDTGSPFTLEFKNGSTTAFSFRVESTTKFTTKNASSVEAFARTISESLSLSATNGVDPKDAEYALYATMTGAKDVKLEAGMDEVTFSNGITVNFDKLTVSDVTVNEADYTEQQAANAPAVIEATGYTSNTAYAGANNTSASAEITYSDFAAGDVELAAGSVPITASYDGTSTLTFTATMNGEEYTATADANTFNTDGATATLTFKNAAGDATGFTVNAALASTTKTGTAGATVNYAEADALAALGGGITLEDTSAAAAAAANFTAGTADTATPVTFSGTAAAEKVNWTGTTSAPNKFGGTSLTVSVGGTDFTVALVDGPVTSTDSTEIDISSMKYADLYAAMQEAINTQIAAHNEAGLAGSADFVKIDPITFPTMTSTSTQLDSLTDVTTTTTPQTYTAPAEGSATYHRVFCSEDESVTKSTFKVRGTEGDGMIFQIGANQGDELQIFIEELNCDYLGVGSVSVLTRTQSSEALGAVDKALNQVASQRAYLGAMQNRLEYKINNLDTSAENLSAAEAQIRDVDMAKEMTKFTNANILAQASTAMLAQANSLPQNVLSLLQG